MKQFEWNQEKNLELKRERGISFERIIYAVQQGNLIDVIDHPNSDRYPNQSIYVVNIGDYIYLVPFVTQADGTRFLKTIIPSRKATRDYLRKKKMNEKLDSEEREILSAFESGELRSRPDAQAEIHTAQEAARNTFNKTRRVNLRLTEYDFEQAHVRALEEGLPYQTLLSSIIHKYLTGRLVERTDR